MHLESQKNGVMNFSFGPRSQPVDWRKLASVDMDRLVRDMDMKMLQDNILHITYCNLETEMGMQSMQFGPHFLKLFRLAQLIIEYLLHCQECLQTSLEIEMTKVQETMQSAEQVRKELDHKSELHSKQKKEIKRLKKWIAEYQLMMRAGASGIHKCPYCAKAFVSQEYLLAHLSRRHDDHPIANGSVKPMTVTSKPAENETAEAEKAALIEEVKQIKDRLYATERDLMNERNAREMQYAKDRNQFSNDDQKVKELESKYEQWKMQEDENHRRELMSLRQSLQREIQNMSTQNQQEKKALTQALADLEYKMNSRPSMIGNIKDEDELDAPPKFQPNNKEEIAEMVREEFENQLQQVRVQSQEEMQRELRRMNQKWKSKEERLQHEHQKEVVKVQDLLSQYGSKLEAEQAEKERLVNMVENLSKQLQNQENNRKAVGEEVQQAAIPRQQQALAATPPRREVTFSDKDDTISLYISANTNNNHYRLWRQRSDGSNEWVDKFNFTAYLKPLGPFTTPLYVYTASGSPYWRQYISASSDPPSTEYRLEYMFFVSRTAVPGAVELHLLETGTLSVIRSCVNKAKALQGWKYKGESFYVMKSGRAANANSLTSSWGADSTLTEDRDEDSDESESLLEEQPLKSDTPERPNTKPADVPVADSLETTEEMDDMMTTPGSTSEWGTSTLLRGEFRPFPHNPDITTRYKHTLEEVNACRQEIEEVLHQRLAKQGLQTSTGRLSTQKLEARMAALTNERQARAKKTRGYEELRLSLAKQLEEVAKRHYKGKSNPPPADATAPRQSAKPPTFRAAGTAARTAVSLGPSVKTSTRSSATLSSTGSADVGSSYGDQSFSGTSVTERTLSESDDDDEEYSDEESGWDSGGEIPARAAPARNQQLPQPRPFPTSPQVSVRIPTDDVESDPEDFQPAPQRNAYKPPEPRGGKVRALTSTLERSLSFDETARKPAGAVAVPGKQEAFDVEDEESDFSLSSLDDKLKPVPAQRSGQGKRDQGNAPVPASRSRPVPSPRSTLTQQSQPSAVTAFSIDDYSDFDDSDLDVHHLT
ncbi:uncharacterized protein LOC5503868 isoform X2 [Nematostella vectensis]|uniref:uncharacterized protein LOC5503868 isoform X2 n=1 Tax=Nematostella vectensis TaxID=45351 RepID=UPI00207751C6|nr:uncharacterized protein LOC5503868 isoform X2 [Nematostella vectensis]